MTEKELVKTFLDKLKGMSDTDVNNFDKVSRLAKKYAKKYDGLQYVYHFLMDAYIRSLIGKKKAT